MPESGYPATLTSVHRSYARLVGLVLEQCIRWATSRAMSVLIGSIISRQEVQTRAMQSKQGLKRDLFRSMHVVIERQTPQPPLDVALPPRKQFP